jgi:uncharacterized protein (UPF0210 family)
MEIRSITYFADPGFPLKTRRIRAAGDFLKQARAAFESAGYPVQTTRLATIPFASLFVSASAEQTIIAIQQMEAAAQAAGIDYLAIGPALPEIPSSYEIIPDILAATEIVFASGLITTPTSVSLPAVQACGRVMHALTSHEANGFGNLYFAALANVAAGAPFFPAAYHHTNQPPAFALALEAADLAVSAFGQIDNLQTARQGLLTAVQRNADALSRVAETLAKEHSLIFDGLDFTLAPYPTVQRSLGAALEELGVPGVGLQGTLAAAAFLTSTLEAASYRRTGFNGLMLPVLEDAVLAERAAGGALTVNDLLLYSAVCGTGLDTIPLPGDATPEALAAVLLDLGALAHRLDKPLTARLMPIPGKRAGDNTDFDFPYFANSRVMALKYAPLSAPLSGEERLELNSRIPAKYALEEDNHG